MFFPHLRRLFLDRRWNHARQDQQVFEVFLADVVLRRDVLVKSLNADIEVRIFGSNFPPSYFPRIRQNLFGVFSENCQFQFFCILGVLEIAVSQLLSHRHSNFISHHVVKTLGKDMCIKWRNTEWSAMLWLYSVVMLIRKNGDCGKINVDKI